MTIHRVADFDGVQIIESDSISDQRGTFLKFHPLKELEDSLDSIAISINSKLGTIRGLHFQVEPFAEEKLITCIQGSIFDVIVDLRPNSRTFGKWTSFVLSAANRLQLYLPKGIAHGFQTLQQDVIIHYSLTSSFSPHHAHTLDPFGELQVSWPIEDFTISDKDRQGATLPFCAQKYAESLQS